MSWATFDLSELAETTVFGGVPAVERDLYWEPKTLGEIKNGSHKDSPPNQETDIGETMTDESGTEIHPSDVVSAEEFLFGHATDDTPADVGGELPAGDAADDAPVDVDEEQDADGETAEEPDVADGGGVQPAQGETETTEELKVVVSIRARPGHHRGATAPRRTRTSSRSMTWTWPGWPRRSRR